MLVFILAAGFKEILSMKGKFGVKTLNTIKGLITLTFMDPKKTGLVQILLELNANNQEYIINLNLITFIFTSVLDESV